MGHLMICDARARGMSRGVVLVDIIISYRNIRQRSLNLMMAVTGQVWTAIWQRRRSKIYRAARILVLREVFKIPTAIYRYM